MYFFNLFFIVINKSLYFFSKEFVLGIIQVMHTISKIYQNIAIICKAVKSYSGRCRVAFSEIQIRGSQRVPPDIEYFLTYC